MRKMPLDIRQNVIELSAIFEDQFSIVDFESSITKERKRSDIILGKVGKFIFDESLNNQNSEEKIRYVVDMDDNLLEAIDNGSLKFLTGKDGSIYAQLLREDGKFGKRLSIKKELDECGISKIDFQTVLQMKVIEEQMKQIIEVLADIETKVSTVLRGQHNDRKGLFYGGISLFLEAREVEDEQLKKQMIAQALQCLNEANYQMIQELRSNLEFLLTEQYRKSKKSVEAIEEAISNIYKCYEVIFKSTFVKAAIFQYCGEISAMLIAIDEYRKFIEKMIVPFAGKLSEFDKNNKLIASSTWANIEKTLSGCSEMKKKIEAQRFQKIC